MQISVRKVVFLEQDKGNKGDKWRMENSEFIKEGYLFQTKTELQIAESERKKIDFLETKIDYNRPEMVLRLYEKAVNERVFKGPVGIAYLKKLQEYLLDSGIDATAQIPPIPVLPAYGERVVFQKKSDKNKKEKAQVDYASRFKMSLIINLVLVLAVIAMFFIAFKAGQPNILNYERVITNQYSKWEQDLTRREQAVKEKERQLMQDGSKVDENVDGDTD